MPRCLLCLTILAALAGGVLAATAPVPAAASAPAPATAAAPAAAAPGKSAELAAGEQKLALATEIQDAVTRQLGSLDPAVREQGRLRLLQIRDPLAVEPITRILGGASDDMKQIACQMLGQIPSEDAAKQLAKFALTEPSEAVRTAAIKGIKVRSDRLALTPLLNGLRGQVGSDAVNRAAAALGECADYPAALIMCNYLWRLEGREVEVMVTDQPAGSFMGTTQAYVAGTRAVANGGVVAQVPIIGWTSQGVGMGSSPAAPPEPHPEKVPVNVRAPQPVIRDALQKITGQNFEFNTQQWRDWLNKTIDEEKRAAREPGYTTRTHVSPPPPEVPIPAPPQK